MDALLPAFLAALLAEMGDKTQFLAILLAARFSRHGAVLGGIALAALLNALLAAFLGKLIHPLLSFHAVSLMVALALLFAGAGALWRQKPPELPALPAIGAFLVSAVAFSLLEFGDKTQFLTVTLAARADAPWLAALGATAGVTLAMAPAVALGSAWPASLPLGALRRGVGLLFLLVGAIVAVGALRLV